MAENTTQAQEQHRPAVTECRNCSADVRGYVYCPVCGQKSDTHVFTFRELLEEIADGLFNMDSRVWRSLLPLALKPGKLTLEYLRGRRMYYLPPFRLYLILSVLFFLISVDLSVESVSTQSLDDTNLEQVIREALEARSQSPEDDPADTAGTIADVVREVQQELDGETGSSDGEAQPGAGEAGQSPADFCGDFDFFTGATSTAVFTDLCMQLQEDGVSLVQDLIDSIPVMMIIGIPLVALIMQLLYAFSGRYYVEHIIFLLHVHAFYFLVNIAMTLSSIVGERIAFLSLPLGWFNIIAGFYIPVYIFLSLRRVYGDGNGKTFFKALVLLIGYGLCIGIVGTAGLVYTALARVS